MGILKTVVTPPAAVIAFTFRYSNPNPYPTDTEEQVLSMGNPVFFPLKFESTNYQKRVNGEVANFSTPDLFIPVVIIDCEQQKVQEQTPVEGRDGTTKEFAALDDFRGTIKGIIIGEMGAYPSEAVKALQAVCNAPVSVDVACEYLQQFNVFQIMLGKIRWVAMPGYTNCQAFEIPWASDDDLLYQLNNNS